MIEKFKSVSSRTRYLLQRVILFIAIVAAGALLTWWMTDHAARELRTSILTEGRLIANAIHMNCIGTLTGTEADLNSPEYICLKEQLSAARTIVPQCSFVYLMNQSSDGSIYFMVDSEPADSEDYSPPGQIYEEATKNLLEVFDDRTMVVIGPASDRWGTWISAMVPLIDEQSGELIAVLGMDIDAQKWRWMIARTALAPILLTVALVAILLIGSTLLVRRKIAEDALRESEAVLHSILDATPSGVGLLQDRRFMKVNNALCKITGYTEEEMLGQLTRILYPTEEEYLRIGTELYEAMEKTGLGQLEARFRTKDGSDICVILSLTPFVLDAEVAGVCATVQDITERKRSEDEKTRLEEQVRQFQKMESVGRLAGGLAHDFNNMLSVILGHTEMALNSIEPSQPFRSDLEEIRKAAQRSADLTKQLLAFARKQTVAPKVLDVNFTVEGMLKMLQRLIGEEIELVWQPGDNIWSIRMDLSQIDQILANLCINARDAINGIGRVIIETDNKVFDSEYCTEYPDFIPGDYVLLSVSDNGCGIDKETLAHIYEPFFTTKEMGRGTGLGLSTIYGIIKQNNGFINAYSEPGLGTTFKIYLPRYERTGQMPAEKEATQETERGQETILLVEDEATILKMTTRMLISQGYKVLSANTPVEAIRLAEGYSDKIHLLMTDVVMPEMNGRDLAKNLLSFHPNIKRLFMSGYTADVIANHGVLDEGVHFIQKPFSLKDLAAKVREVLESE